MPHERPRPPVLGPRRGARDLPRLAQGRSTRTPATGCSSPRPGSTTRSGWPATSRPDELHTAFNFDFVRAAWDADDAARAPSTSCLRGRRLGRRADDLGAVQPRRHPARHPLRPAGLDRRRRVRRATGSVRTPRSTRPRPAPGPGRRAADARPARARPTSTRARSSACRRSWTCPRTSLAGPDLGALRRTPSAAATAAGCRCRGPATARRFGFGAGAPWLPQPADWADAVGRGAGAASRARRSSCTGARCGCAARAAARRATARSTGCRSPAGSLSFRRTAVDGDRGRVRGQPRRPSRCRSRRTTRCWWRTAELATGADGAPVCPADTAVWLPAPARAASTLNIP